MSNSDGSFEKPEPGAGRLGFIADLGFILCATWLVLWRTELYGATRGSIWASWWPALVLGGLIGAATVVGLSQRKSHGFLPYSFRWALLAVLLVLPAWLALSLLDAGTRDRTIRSVAHESRREAAQLLAAADSPEERQRQQRVVDAADAGLKLAEALDAAKAKGIEVPTVDLVSQLSPDELERLGPGTVDTLEEVLGIAEAIEQGGSLPPDVAEVVSSAGLDNPKVMLALLGLLAALLAPALGLSSGLILKILQALVINGSLSLGGLLRVVPALLGSIGPNGIDPIGLNQRLDEYGAMAGDLVEFMNAMEEMGGDEVRGSQPFQKIKDVVTEASGRPAADRVCPPEQRERARAAAQGDRERLRAELANRCPQLKPSDVDELVRSGR
ncbi:hypothetical protein [Nannocystis punicea]|uniref:Uncharacterized protein n=1 Tax=Nannocystis punicea TaxID=2995304 RepID=A0ABY7HBN4_9BACT|nr:hypothetical protein [Nannocystis poenicansa]WAS96414.1 hypothetical protein O0S08_09665 [Nannocystis poenicansa]